MKYHDETYSDADESYSKPPSEIPELSIFKLWPITVSDFTCWQHSRHGHSCVQQVADLHIDCTDTPCIMVEGQSIACHFHLIESVGMYAIFYGVYYTV